MRDQDFRLLELIASINNLDNNYERRKYYILNRQHLTDYNMVYVDLENGNDHASHLNDFVEMDYDFNSLFYSNRIMVMNQEVLFNDSYYHPSYIIYQVCISLDLNIVSLLKEYKDVEKCEDEVLSKVIQICKEKCCAFDIMPYVIENFLKNPKKQGLDDLSIADIRKFEEMFPYKDSRLSFRTVDINTRMNQLLTMYRSDWFKEMCVTLYNDIYQLEYIYLLAIIHIFFKYNKLSGVNKFDKFMEFCANEIRAFHPCACNLAKLFYENQNLRFFKKIQKSNKNIIASIENMAWDLFHLRFMEKSVELSHPNKEIVMVPIFITKDKGLNEIRKAYQLKCLFQNLKTGEVIASYYMNSITEKYIKKYFNRNSIRERMESVHDFNKLSIKLEQMIIEDISD